MNSAFIQGVGNRQSSMKFTRIHFGSLCLVIVAAASCSKPEIKGTPSSDTEVTQHVSEPSSNKAAFYTVDHYDDARNPADDLSATIKRAQVEKKNILVQVGGDWCGWCHLMSTFIETDEKVRDTILENYLVMKVTEDADNKNTAFLSQYPSIPGYPHLFVLDSNGKLLHSQGTAELEQGHGYNETAYLEFLNKWKPVR